MRRGWFAGVKPYFEFIDPVAKWRAIFLVSTLGFAVALVSFFPLTSVITCPPTTPVHAYGTKVLIPKIEQFEKRTGRRPTSMAELRVIKISRSAYWENMLVQYTGTSPDLWFSLVDHSRTSLFTNPTERIVAVSRSRRFDNRHMVLRQHTHKGPISMGTTSPSYIETILKDPEIRIDPGFPIFESGPRKGRLSHREKTRRWFYRTMITTGSLSLLSATMMAISKRRQTAH